MYIPHCPVPMERLCVLYCLAEDQVIWRAVACSRVGRNGDRVQGWRAKPSSEHNTRSGGKRRLLKRRTIC